LTQVKTKLLRAALYFKKYGGRVAGRHRDPTPMSDHPIWEPIASAPYDRDLELAVIDAHHVHPLVFACRRTAAGWIRESTHERVIVSPTHWRPWSRHG
jgi:hypothetical protein